MTTSNSTPRVLFWTIPVITLMAIAAAVIINWAETSRAQLPVLSEVPRFAFTERSGKPVTQDDLMGHLTVVDFIFTNCRGICPTMSANMSELYQLYQSSDKVHFLSISVDPDRDSLAVLQRYANSFGVDDNRWLFARGALVDVAHLMEKGFMLSAEELPAGHPSQFILVDDKAQIRGYFTNEDSSGLIALKTQIRELARAMP
jgi:protein SCO1